MLLSDYEANQGGYVATEGSIRENETVKALKKKKGLRDLTTSSIETDKS